MEQGSSQVDRAVVDVYGERALTTLDWIRRNCPGLNSREQLSEVGQRAIPTQSEFFRERNLWTIAVGALPMLAAEMPGKPVEILEVGCSTGEESYSLAATILGQGHEDFSIDAIDVNPRCIAEAIEGKYLVDEAFEELATSGRRFPVGLMAAGYFENTGETWLPRISQRPRAIIRPSEQLRQKINFIQHDMIAAPYGADYDLAIANNLLMHFPDHTRDKIFANILASVRRGGLVTIERKLNPLSANEKAWLDPYNAWRDSLESRFELTRAAVPDNFDLFFQTAS